MVNTIKFSQMTPGGDIAPNEKTPGLLGGSNVLFNNAFPNLAPGSTADRPPIDPSMYYRLRFNTTLESYEYYSPVEGDWAQLEDSLDNYVGPFVTFTAAADITGNFDLGSLTSGILKQTVLAGVSTPAIAVNAVDYWAPGDALTRTQVPVIGDDVTNKTYVDGLDSGNVKSVTGTTNEIDVDNTDPANPILALSATLNMPGTFNIQGTTAVSAIINDDTMATAAATNLATALSIKNYIDGLDSGSVKSVTGTANEIDVNNTDPQNPILALSATLDAPGTFTIQASTAVDEIINDDTMATATATNLATALSIKNYVDSIAAGFTLINPVRVASTANLVATYSNGASGVGATLTVTALGVASIDGVALSLNDRVLFKDQSTTFQNGIYYVSDVGSGGTSAVYTRTTDFDQPSEIDPGDLVPVLAGSTLSGTLWLQTATAYTNVVTLTGTQTITGDKTFSGTTTLDNFIFDTNQMQHASDTNNYFEFGTDTQNFVTGGSSRMDLSDTGLRLGAANSRVTTILDEDNMASDSATALATQQSIKAYVDASPGRLKSFQIFTSGTAQTYTKPAGITSILVEVLGGGGAGGGCTAGGAGTVAVAGGGGAGGYARLWVPSAAASYTYTVGAGGTSGGAGASGNAGGTTTFSASSLQATGGGGASATTSVANTGGGISSGAAGGVGSNGDFNCNGERGDKGIAIVGLVSSGEGGSSIYGAGGAPVNVADGSAGLAYGSGGSGGSTGTTTNRAGGAGSAGLIIVWEFS